MWGTTALINSSLTCAGVPQCGEGAVGIENLWHHLDTNGKPVPGGGNPLWHALNLEQGIIADYLAMYGVTDTTLTGTYQPNYSATMAVPWLWNATKRVFISTETAHSIGAKARYIVDNDIGGIMIWELAGD